MISQVFQVYSIRLFFYSANIFQSSLKTYLSAVRLSNFTMPGDEEASDEAAFRLATDLDEAHREAEHLKEAEAEVGIHSGANYAAAPEAKLQSPRSGYRRRFQQFIETSKTKKTPKLILQIWQSDYSIIAFVLVMASFYLMKDTNYPPVGVLFFLMGMATVDAILSIFVVRLSFHQNKHGFYRTEDFERDWLRYRMLLSMTKAALLFVVATSCGTAAVIASYVGWFFTSTQRLRYLILRWSMDDHYPELQRWSIFALLREVGIEPKLRNFNLMAILGIVTAFAISFIPIAELKLQQTILYASLAVVFLAGIIVAFAARTPRHEGNAHLERPVNT